MRILLVAHHYPPDPAVGALRAGRIAVSLAERGHEIHVLASPLPDEPAVRVGDRITVERLVPLFDPRSLLTRLKRRLRTGSEATQGSTARDGALPSDAPFWKRQIVALLWLPDDRQGWAAAAVRHAKQLRPIGFDLVYTTAPPFSAHVAGLLLRRRRSGARWIAEFRDPWTDNPAKPKSGRTRWSDTVERWLERACLRRADRVICVADSAAHLLRRRLGRRGDKVDVVRNGIDAPPTPVRAAGPGNGRVLYAGNLYHSRDPRPILRGLAALNDAGRLPPGAGIDFIGACASYRGVDVAEFAAGLGVAELVRIAESVPHERSLALIREASALLLLAQDQPYQVPNKLYEYLGAGRPIIAFADARGETARMLSEVGGHYVLASPDPAAAADAILAALGEDGERNGSARAVLEEWSIDRQFARLAAIVEATAGVGTP